MVFDEKENFEGEKKIAEMLSTLNRVREPSDFNTHVRARIANGRLSDRAGAWPVNLIRTAAPLAAAIVIALGGYFVLTSVNTDQNDVPAVAETRSEPRDSIVEQPASNVEVNKAESRATVKPSDDLVAENNGAYPENGKGKTSGPNAANAETRKDGSAVGSTDVAVRGSNSIFPRGLNPNAKPQANAKGVDPNARIPVASILEFIGVKATWAGDGWRVDNVEPNNIASRSGIRNGDVVEAINGQSVDNKTTFPARFEGKSVRVRRSGTSLSIDFKP
ncbi:MAG: hypothetical protein ACKVQW_11740 [Pyrinomonadaceae bacterium]